eukprot:596231-Pelagomonas_calceolata.AAC.2
MRPGNLALAWYTTFLFSFQRKPECMAAVPALKLLLKKPWNPSLLCLCTGMDSNALAHQPFSSLHVHIGKDMLSLEPPSGSQPPAAFSKLLGQAQAIGRAPCYLAIDFDVPGRVQPRYQRRKPSIPCGIGFMDWKALAWIFPLLRASHGKCLPTMAVKAVQRSGCKA